MQIIMIFKRLLSIIVVVYGFTTPPIKPPLGTVKPKTGGGGNNPDIVVLQPDYVKMLINDWSMIPSQDNRDIQKMRFLCSRFDKKRNFFFGYQPQHEFRRRIRYIFHAEIVLPIDPKNYSIAFTHYVANPHDMSGISSAPFRKKITEQLQIDGQKKITPVFDKLLEDKRIKLSWSMTVTNS